MKALYLVILLVTCVSARFVEEMKISESESSYDGIDDFSGSGSMETAEPESSGDEDQSGFGLAESSGDEDQSGFGLPEASGYEDQSGFGLAESSRDEDQSGFGLPESSEDEDQSGFGLQESSGDEDQSGFGLPESSGDEDQSGFGLPESSGDGDQSGIDHKFGKKIAFSVYLSKDKELGKNQHIKFDKVLVNDGNGYHASTGTFRAEVDGVYVFTYVVAQRHHHEFRARLVYNGKVVNGAVANGMHKYHDVQGTNTAIIHMCKGKYVWIEASNRGHLEGNNADYRYTTFSGYLLYERR